MMICLSNSAVSPHVVVAWNIWAAVHDGSVTSLASLSSATHIKMNWHQKAVWWKVQGSNLICNKHVKPQTSLRSHSVHGAFSKNALVKTVKVWSEAAIRILKITTCMKGIRLWQTLCSDIAIARQAAKWCTTFPRCCTRRSNLPEYDLVWAMHAIYSLCHSAAQADLVNCKLSVRCRSKHHLRGSQEEYSKCRHVCVPFACISNHIMSVHILQYFEVFLKQWAHYMLSVCRFATEPKDWTSRERSTSGYMLPCVGWRTDGLCWHYLCLTTGKEVAVCLSKFCGWDNATPTTWILPTEHHVIVQVDIVIACSPCEFAPSKGIRRGGDLPLQLQAVHPLLAQEWQRCWITNGLTAAHAHEREAFLLPKGYTRPQHRPHSMHQHVLRAIVLMSDHSHSVSPLCKSVWLGATLRSVKADTFLTEPLARMIASHRALMYHIATEWWCHAVQTHVKPLSFVGGVCLHLAGFFMPSNVSMQ